MCSQIQRTATAEWGVFSRYFSIPRSSVWPFHNLKISFIYLTQNSSRRRVSVSLISKESQVFINFLAQLPHLSSTMLEKQTHNNASSSVQEIKRHLKKREMQNTKKSGRSGSQSSESSCSGVTKEDGCLLEDRWLRASPSGRPPPLTSPTFPPTPPSRSQASHSRWPFTSSASPR